MTVSTVRKNKMEISSSSSKISKKRIKIKPFQRPPKLPSDFYETTSRELLLATSVLLQRINNSNKPVSSLMTKEKNAITTTTTTTNPSSSPSLQHCYNSVVNLVSHQFGPKLYHDLVLEFQASARIILPEEKRNFYINKVPITTSISSNTSSINSAASTAALEDSTQLLSFLSEQYPKYVDYLLLVRHVFLPLDRPYVWETADSDNISSSNNNNNNNGNGRNTNSNGSRAIKRTSPSQMSLLEVGLAQFHKRLLLELSWDDDAYQAWWKLLWNAFLHETKSPGVLQLLESTMGMWKDLSVARSKILQTQPLFEAALGELAFEWQSSSGKYSPEAFLKFVSNQWHYISNYWSNFLPKTWLRTIVEVRLLEPHLNKEYLLKVLDITNLNHCEKLWHLAARLENGTSRVIEAVCNLVKKQGLEQVEMGCNSDNGRKISSPGKSTSNGDSNTQIKSPVQISKVVISELLQMHSQLQKLQSVVGEIPLKAVWTEIMNHSSLVAEWLAKYVDIEFKNFKVEKSLEPLLYLFTHVQAKDVFEAFYKKDLAKRLLFNRVRSMDLERQFVSLLKAECGAGYTSKMEGMFQDVEWSRESLARYKESPEFKAMKQQVSTLSATKSVIDFEVQILTTGYWPVYPQYASLVLPEELKEQQSFFWNHYKSKYQGRKIVWQYALGNSAVTFSPKEGSREKYDFIVNLIQSLIMLCFNERSSWTMPELMQRIGLEDEGEMERNLVSLSSGKENCRILVRKRAEGNGRKTQSKQFIRSNDKIMVNESFKSNSRRIRVPNMSKKETKEERDKVVETISRDRLYLIDAVLVRILKARKTILHQQLIPQILEQIKVPAQLSDIKKRIESLIEREYMERDENDRQRYNYLA